MGETNAIWYGTMIVDDGRLGDAVSDINALRMRTQEGFPNFGLRSTTSRISSRSSAG